jgi:hypothetical protein
MPDRYVWGGAHINAHALTDPALAWDYLTHRAEAADAHLEYNADRLGVVYDPNKRVWGVDLGAFGPALRVIAPVMQFTCVDCGKTTTDPDRWDPHPDTGDIRCDHCWYANDVVKAVHGGTMPWL